MATSYTMQRIVVSSGAATSVYIGSATSATDYVVPGTYQYEVQACNASGCSGWTHSGNVNVMCVEAPGAVKANGVQPFTLKCN